MINGGIGGVLLQKPVFLGPVLHPSLPIRGAAKKAAVGNLFEANCSLQDKSDCHRPRGEGRVRARAIIPNSNPNSVAEISHPQTCGVERKRVKIAGVAVNFLGALGT